MHLSVLHQPLPALHPLRVAPDERDMVGERAVNGLVVGVAKDAACGCDELRVRGIGQHAVPSVRGDPAGAGHAPFALVIGIAARHGADGFHGDGVAVDQRQVLRGRHIVGRGIDRLLHRFRAHHLHRGGKRGVFFGQEGRGDRGHMPRRRDAAKVVVATGQHRSVVGPAQGNGDRVGIGDIDDGRAFTEPLEPVGGAVFLGVVGVQLFDIDVLVVDIGGGQPPAQIGAAAREHHGHARNGAADHAARLQLKSGQIPDCGGGETQVRIIGQKRAARSRARGRCGPSVGSAGEGLPFEWRQRVTVHRHRGGVARRHLGKEGGIFGQGGDPAARRIGQDIAQAVLVAQLQRHPCAQHFGLQMTRHLQAHQLGHRERIRRSPRSHGRIEQPHLRRAPAQGFGVDLIETRVDPGGIGFECGLGLGVELIRRGNGEAI